MIDFKKIQDKLGMYKNNRKYYLSMSGRTPYSDWHLLLLLMVVLLIYVSLSAYNTHLSVQEEMNDVVEFNSRGGVLDEGEVIEFQEKYDNRAKLLNSLR